MRTYNATMDITWVLVILLIATGAYLLLRYGAAIREIVSLRNEARQLDEQVERLARQVTDEQQIRQALAETLIDPVFYVDADRSILYSNTAAQQLTRGAAQPGHSLMEAVRSYELDNFVEETLAAQNELPQEITLNERLFRMRSTVISDESGKRSAIVTLRDISELQRLGRARRDFVANISHELRTP
ncbi:MAG TPA: PAS domain-containing protein, partial [Anaerolineae bacterium]